MTDPRSVSAAQLSRRLVQRHNLPPVLPRPNRATGYPAHTVRHLVERVSYPVGANWLAENPALEDSFCPQIFPDALLGHVPAKDTLGYKDLAHNRDLWTLRAALGEPGRGVPGVLDLLLGEAGARHGWNVQELQTICMRHRQAKKRLEKAQAELAARQLELNAIEDKPLPIAPKLSIEQAEALLESQDAGIASLRSELRRLTSLVELLLARDLAAEQSHQAMVRLNRQITTIREEIDAAQAARDQIKDELKDFRDRGRTLPLLDETPTTDELRDAGQLGAHGLDEETWEEVVERADVPIESIFAIEKEVARIRHLLNIAEFAAVLGMTPGGLRKRLSGRHEPYFDLEGPDSPLVTIPGHPKLRFIDVDKLPRSFRRSLLPEQRMMIDQLLAVPMGSTRWGGRRLPAGAEVRPSDGVKMNEKMPQ